MLTIGKNFVYGLESAVRSMRNPLNSWSKSDSSYVKVNNEFEIYMIGENDLKLCKALIKSGNSDRKFLRMIHVTVDITAPLYWWKDMDQYKVATVTNGCSTMHKIHSKDLSFEDFSCEHLNPASINVLKDVISEFNINRRLFKETNDKEFWWQMIQLLPSSYNQMRTWDGNYETLLSLYFQRRHHKLDEFHTLCNWIETLPYMKDFIEVLDKKEE